MNRARFAVGFDFDHTLGLDHGLERRAYDMLAVEFGCDRLEDRALAAAVDTLLARFRTNELSLDASIGFFVREILGLEKALAPAAAARYRQLCFALADEIVTPLPGATELLAELADDGIPLAILTNGWSPLQQRKIVRALGAFPGEVLVSDRIGTLKPSGAAFSRLAAALQRVPDSIWYVGDNPLTDVAGAHAAGMRAVWFDWEGQTYPDEIAPPDARIAALREFLAVVRGS